MDIVLVTSVGRRYIDPDAPIGTMKNLHAFCGANKLPSGRISKLQGGYYFLSNDFKWERIFISLNGISYKELYYIIKRKLNEQIMVVLEDKNVSVTSCYTCPASEQLIANCSYMCNVRKEIIDWDMGLVPNECPINSGKSVKIVENLVLVIDKNDPK